jgi:2-keto-4-pentenoate hydratase/2-oxohepta-3-ene-1,7-dioic acid hydratase in catechol pathway
MEQAKLVRYRLGHDVAYVSAAMNLEPGDVLLTGTPAGVGPLLPGDHVVVEIEGIGTLENEVAYRG